jgi:hypothetical protein
MANALGWPMSTTNCLPRVTAGVKQIALKHRVVLRRKRDNHGRILRTLAFMYRRRIGQRHLTELLAAHPDLTRDDVQACLAYARDMVIGREVTPKPPKGLAPMPPYDIPFRPER